MDQMDTKNDVHPSAESPSSKELSSTIEVDREDLTRFQTTPEGNSRSVVVSIFFLVVALFVGVPVWLKTTATYQAPLPFWDIKALCSRSIQVTIPVKLISFTDALSDSDLSIMKSDLATSDDTSLRCGTSPASKYSRKLNVSCAVHVRSVSVDDQNTVRKTATQSSSLKDFLIRLENLFPSYLLNEAGSHDCTATDCQSIASSIYTIAILPDTVHALLVKHSQTALIVPPDPTMPVAIMYKKANTNNLIHIVLPSSQSSDHRHQLTSYLARLLNTVLLSMNELEHLVHSSSNMSQVEPVADRELEASITQALTRQLPPSNAYDITVTVVTNADEARENATKSSTATWHEQMLRDPTIWLENHVQSAFESWLPHVRVQFFSQRLHAVDIEQLVPSRISTDRKYRYYTPDDLSTLVNHLESYLGAPQAASAATRDLAGTKPGLHLILSLAMPISTNSAGSLICPQPLRFHLTSRWSPFTVTNVAVVPQWGGLFAIDAPASCSSDQSPTTDSQSTMLARHLVAVIQSLLGLPPDRQSQLPNLIELYMTDEKDAFRGHTVLHSRLDGWFLRRTIESLLSIKLTMTSLVDLLSRFPNMVINDHVANEVRRSTEVWARTLNALANLHAGLNHTASDLGEVFDSAQDALESVNSAFFDHSLLGRLYFQVVFCHFTVGFLCA
ncbi:Phosphatidylinositol glycan class S [Fasciola gigantica]|uniref:Phosphatidylinositol glycan class S n=1 Tax=Fasciola gigantica TaxID=46835 RepID=A0A504Y7W6_FASGI|nr:Phosphatidylinositol glycan class S [Fasciola gigantica]